MKKKPFLLLEVLIALSLVLLCALPLILKPIQAYRSEMHSFEEVEGERLADWTFSEIKELLLKNGLPWESLPNRLESSGPFSLEPEFIQIPGREKKSVRRSFTLFGKGEKLGLQGEIYRLIYVKIFFEPSLSKKKRPYTYRLTVQRIPKPKPL